ATLGPRMGGPGGGSFAGYCPPGHYEVIGAPLGSLPQASPNERLDSRRWPVGGGGSEGTASSYSRAAIVSFVASHFLTPMEQEQNAPESVSSLRFPGSTTPVFSQSGHTSDDERLSSIVNIQSSIAPPNGIRQLRH
ncbi:MAG: hypothetical protein ACREDR_27090, partial [Blastocatellia bacterium]